MIKSIIAKLRRKQTPSPDPILAAECEKRHPLSITSDGQNYVEGGRFSVVIDEIEYEWDIAPLARAANRGEYPIKKFTIPDKFDDQWFWGDTTVDEHVIRSLNADFNIPILVWDGQIIDGAHRCCLALAAGINTLNAHVITNMPPYDREYTPRAGQRNPNDPKRTHKAVIAKVNTFMFTPLPMFTTRHIDD